MGPYKILSRYWGGPEAARLSICSVAVGQLVWIVAPVMINGKGPFRLIVDTGASYSTISPQLSG
jgi:hypothetical protein